MPVSKLLFRDEVTAHDVDNVAHRIIDQLGTVPAPFCLWLQGGLGAGKTTVVGAMLRCLGLPLGVPVTSPTYTYVNEYKILSHGGPLWYAHLDLYRAGEHAHPEDWGLADVRTFRGFFVEWPEVMADPGILLPTHRLTIEVTQQGNARRYTLERETC